MKKKPHLNFPRSENTIDLINATEYPTLIHILNTNDHHEKQLSVDLQKQLFQGILQLSNEELSNTALWNITTFHPDKK